MKVKIEDNENINITFEGTDEINFIYHLLNNEEYISFKDYKKNNNVPVVDIGWDIWNKLDNAIECSDVVIEW